MWLDSDPGLGSTFYFVLEAGFESEAERIPPSVLDGVPVLIVDDNASSRQILAEIVSAREMGPALAGTSVEALDLLDRSNAADVLIAVALIDCDMPGTDGIALVEEIYRRYMSSSPRIVLLSSAGLAWSSGDRAITSDSRQADQPGPSVPDHQSSDNSFKSEFPYGSDTEASRLPTLRFGPARRMSRLLAEDNRINQEVVWRLLEKGVVTSSSPPMDSKPFEAFRSQAFDVVLMDVQMPGCSGLEATARIRVHEAGRSRTPIIALTANCMSGDRERCVFAGMDGFLTKPFRAADLFEEIDRVSSLERIPQ